MSSQIAQAAVDDATIHFDKLYSYCIPPRLNDKVWPGSMVLVPFGRGNKPRMAVVLSVAALPEDADTQKLKTLYDAAPAEAQLTPDLLELETVQHKYIRSLTGKDLYVEGADHIVHCHPIVQTVLTIFHSDRLFRVFRCVCIDGLT